MPNFENFAIYDRLLSILNPCVAIENKTRIWLRVTLNWDAGGVKLIRNSEKDEFSEDSERR